jgi:predicted polyphosphate/ATP-dependent NAD kinase
MVKRIGFVVNPIAGMGGRVGLKGTDGVLEDALARGAKPIAAQRGSATLKAFLEISKTRAAAGNPLEVEWYTCSGPMGEDSFVEAGYTRDDFEIVFEYDGGRRTTAEDTKEACKALVGKGIELVVFVGGDGTARDVFSVLDKETLMLGVPSGVKMHSGVFCVNPEVAARIIEGFIDERLDPSQVEIMDLDEERYRKGEWNIKLFGYARTPYEPTYIQGGKIIIREHEEDVIEDIAWYLKEMMEDEPDTLFILGAGGTLLGIAEELELEKSLLGIDAVVNKRLVAKDVNEEKLLELLDLYPEAKIIVSPIGAQGFVLGRGNLQLSPAVLRKIGVDNFMVVATPAKLNKTPALRVDTGDPELDREFTERKHLMVICGDHFKRLHPIGI